MLTGTRSPALASACRAADGAHPAAYAPRAVKRHAPTVQAPVTPYEVSPAHHTITPTTAPKDNDLTHYDCTGPRRCIECDRPRKSPRRKGNGVQGATRSESSRRRPDAPESFGKMIRLGSTRARFTEVIPELHRPPSSRVITTLCSGMISRGQYTMLQR